MRYEGKINQSYNEKEKLLFKKKREKNNIMQYLGKKKDSPQTQVKKVHFA